MQEGFSRRASEQAGRARSKPRTRRSRLSREGVEPWFEHLKKFVDQGVSAFKLDGSSQVIEHPTRKWGNGMTDEEMHNLYPVIYAKQMARGFEDHTQRRAMVYSAGGYAGVQQYVATWAGDTGGGAKPLASMLNLGVLRPLQPLLRHGCLRRRRHSLRVPANLGPAEQLGLLVSALAPGRRSRPPRSASTDQLRYQLLPYLYSTAAEAALTGYPVMRAMSMVYPDDPAWDASLSQYMLGDFLLVSAFSKEVRLPEGDWIDFWSGKRTTGPATLPVEITPTRGGALLVKSGAIIPTWPACDHVEKGWSPEVGLLVYPAAQQQLHAVRRRRPQPRLPQGRVRPHAPDLRNGRTDRHADHRRPGRQLCRHAGHARLHGPIHLPARPQTVTLDGVAVTDFNGTKRASTAIVKIPACGAAPRTLKIN